MADRKDYRLPSNVTPNVIIEKITDTGRDIYYGNRQDMTDKSATHGHTQIRDDQITYARSRRGSFDSKRDQY